MRPIHKSFFMPFLLLFFLHTIEVVASERVLLDDWELPLGRIYEEQEFVLSGTAVLRVGLVFKGYAAALYVDPEKADRPLDPDTAKRLEIYYYHNTPRRRMIDTANETLERNLSAKKLQNLRPLIDKLHRVYRDGEKGGMAALTFIPGKGTFFEMQNELLIHIPGDEFGPAYLKVWLGEQPSSRTVKEQLMRGL